jgi:hypothetical protein
MFFVHNIYIGAIKKSEMAEIKNSEALCFLSTPSVIFEVQYFLQQPVNPDKQAEK